MKKIIGLLGIVVLLSGCTSASEKEEILRSFGNMCDGRVSMDLTLEKYSSKINMHCDAIAMEQISNGQNSSK